jgi:hypothetical protein
MFVILVRVLGPVSLSVPIAAALIANGDGRVIDRQFSLF